MRSIECHKRKCWDCGNIAEHEDTVVPHVLCEKCGSQDTRTVKSTLPKLTPEQAALRAIRMHINDPTIGSEECLHNIGHILEGVSA